MSSTVRTADIRASAHKLDGCQSLVSYVSAQNPFDSVPHPQLDGAMFPNAQAAGRAQYEAGVLGYLTYLGSREFATAVQLIVDQAQDRTAA